MNLNKYWEAKALASMLVALLIITVFSVVKAWIADRRRWRSVRPHYGSRYDASVRMDYRPNVRMMRP